jgi:hypothetical protein
MDRTAAHGASGWLYIRYNTTGIVNGERRGRNDGAGRVVSYFPPNWVCLAGSA